MNEKNSPTRGKLQRRSPTDKKWETPRITRQNSCSSPPTPPPFFPTTNAEVDGGLCFSPPLPRRAYRAPGRPRARRASLASEPGPHGRPAPDAPESGPVSGYRRAAGPCPGARGVSGAKGVRPWEEPMELERSRFTLGRGQDDCNVWRFVLRGGPAPLSQRNYDAAAEEEERPGDADAPFGASAPCRLPPPLRPAETFQTLLLLRSPAAPPPRRTPVAAPSRRHRPSRRTPAGGWAPAVHDSRSRGGGGGGGG